MRPPHVYAFEAVDDALELMPLAARRLLDASGRKLSLDGWRSLSIERRRAIVRAGAAGEVPAELLEGLSQAVPPPLAVEAVAEPEDARAPSHLIGALGPSRPLDDAAWRALGGLDRYALVKCSSRAEKLAQAYEEIVKTARFTHVSAAGAARMVDVADKAITRRRAVASARVRTTAGVVRAIAGGQISKGDVVAVARIAGIMASKRTDELIPLCHPLNTTSACVDVDLDADRGEVRVLAAVEATDRTGVEMEAMVAASVASLTIYDMIKSADCWAVVEGVRLERKSGGKSGDARRPPEREAG